MLLARHRLCCFWRLCRLQGMRALCILGCRWLVFHGPDLRRSVVASLQMSKSLTLSTWQLPRGLSAGVPTSQQPGLCGQLFRNGTFAVTSCDAALPFVCKKRVAQWPGLPATNFGTVMPSPPPPPPPPANLVQPYAIINRGIKRYHLYLDPLSQANVRPCACTHVPNHAQSCSQTLGRPSQLVAGDWAPAGRNDLLATAVHVCRSTCRPLWYVR
jgi:hypothetical protein